VGLHASPRIDWDIEIDEQHSVKHQNNNSRKSRERELGTKESRTY
jgi:hypothetical protein